MAVAMVTSAILRGNVVYLGVIDGRQMMQMAYFVFFIIIAGMVGLLFGIFHFTGLQVLYVSPAVQQVVRHFICGLLLELPVLDTWEWEVWSICNDFECA